MTRETRTLLVVDDNETNRDLLSRRLERKGYRVVTAADGIEALEQARHTPVDLILLDIMMPRLSGLEVLRALRERRSPAELPIIMVSARGDSTDVVEALSLGANDYVTKPIDFAVVLARVQSHLRLRDTLLTAARPAAAVSVPSSAPQEVGPATVLAGKYLLESKLGAGNFGVVYRARHQSLDYPVAIKVLQTYALLGSDPSHALARFQREGVSACRVNHPNAVSVLDFGVTESGVAYLVMELLEGEPLSEELRLKGPLAPMRAAEILRPVCNVLAAAHAVGIIHRDIKPANIFLHHPRSSEIVKVLDFGIAKLVDDSLGHERLTLTMERGLLGTPAYMAPERLSDRPYDGRADVYSVGVMLYEMLTGHPPFRAQDPMAVAIQQISADPPPLRAVNGAVSAAVEAVVMRALTKNPDDRPAAPMLADQFEAAVGGGG